mmetsp:Transcript_43879/g.111102  ORF Transcript_43879/g.111102 Transcript_43879/m.111102 type:complete len:133 (+) Transcript_43879:69-467(+)|eukprot:CAMPEP_0183463054 /NCGR_PEP_ID=MMETSP0370-20130417/142867_1 /TAXON_ID=268820 /ORGANISM="Peridinium aciculiferum, Strain PAER-2" /LENGTH=132 /DNA_ID=CAMNT_0025655139 /DNA_START=83 /DNA_END=481 /DNA_ORIENTATION=-
MDRRRRAPSTLVLPLGLWLVSILALLLTLLDGVCSVGDAGGQGEDLGEDNPEEIMKHMDKDRDNLLSLQEVLEGIAEDAGWEEGGAEHATFKAVFTAHFKTADKNGDNHLDTSEMPLLIEAFREAEEPDNEL